MWLYSVCVVLPSSGSVSRLPLFETNILGLLVSGLQRAPNMLMVPREEGRCFEYIVGNVRDGGDTGI